MKAVSEAIRRLRAESRARLEGVRRRRAIRLSVFAVLVALTAHAGIEDQRERSRQEAERVERAAAEARSDAACAAFDLAAGALQRQRDAKLASARTDMERAIEVAEFNARMEDVRAEAVKGGCLPGARRQPAIGKLERTMVNGPICHGVP
jgi:hypothetical protein